MAESLITLEFVLSLREHFLANLVFPRSSLPLFPSAFDSNRSNENFNGVVTENRSQKLVCSINAK